MKVDIGSPEIIQEIRKPAARNLTPISKEDLLARWDSAIVDLYRNHGMWIAYDVRLRNCSLHYNEGYYIRYRDVTFGIESIFNLR